MSNELVDFVYEQKNQFQKVLSDSTIEFEREASFAVQLLMSNDYLCGVAMKNKDSVRNAVVNVAAIGISLNPASKLAYLVPRKGVVCLDISYMGLMHIAQQSGAIKWGQAQIVREKDDFRLQGIDKPPVHSFNPFDTDRGAIVGVYVVVKTADSDYLTHSMAIADVFSIRDRSESFKSGKSSPWKTDEQEMIKKTCVKQAAKYWPRRDRLDTAVHHVNTEGEEGLTPALQVMSDDEFSAWQKQIDDCASVDSVKALWKVIAQDCKDKNDKKSYDALKDLVAQQAARITNADKAAA
jgi:recombination protein RecT